MIVSNSTPLINFGKQGRLDILKDCFKKIIIPKKVYEEITIKKDSIEAIDLKKAIEQKWVLVEESEVNNLLGTGNLEQGEKEAISLATKHKSILLIDDDSAKAYASLLGVGTHGSFYVLYLACVKKIIDKKEAKKIFERMISGGFYISTELYSRFLELLDPL